MRHVWIILANYLLLLGNAFASSITATTSPTPTQSQASVPTPSTTTLPTSLTSANLGNGTCEARTINYITDKLPQQCLKSAWSASNGTTTSTSSVMAAEGEVTAIVNGTTTEPLSASTSLPIQVNATASEDGNKTAKAVAETVQEEPDASFLSFEEWKQQQIAEKEKEKAAQKDLKDHGAGNKKTGGAGENGLPILDMLAEEAHHENKSSISHTKSSTESTKEDGDKVQEIKKDDEVVESKPRKKDLYRSKDAGKTCKERFSYASFDAGATVLKTHKGAKNSKAVLIENKDSYMLSECSINNKFIIIELSEDIWIDTLVLANYEFFSSMIRTFRVSVSDRYPVPIHKWKDLGTYEARNSREIQAFLIENPQIWARYIRIEFLSHFGNEYYCPLSLVRVHGTRMLESWKTESEEKDEEDENEEEEKETESDGFVPEAVADAVTDEEEKLKTAAGEVEAANEAAKDSTELSQTENVSYELTTPWEKPGSYLTVDDDGEMGLAICVPDDAPAEFHRPPDVIRVVTLEPTTSAVSSTTFGPVHPSEISVSASSRTSSSSHISSESSVSTPATSKDSVSTSETPHSTPVVPPPPNIKVNITSSAAHKSKNATSTSSSTSALPTIQESFFKAVSRRLSLLESNSTLSHHYLTSQLQKLHSSFNTLSKASLTKTTSYLNELNSTVIEELRGFRQQYDEIWQSTVISLESQREENRRENRELRDLVGVLAGEVVWQRRMSIVQSVLLLFCLGLVIFSRASSSESTPFYGVRRNTTFNSIGNESPLEDHWEEEDDEERLGTESMSEDRPDTGVSVMFGSPSYRHNLTPPSSHSPPASRSENLAIPVLMKRSKSTSGESYLTTSSASSFHADSTPSYQEHRRLPERPSTADLEVHKTQSPTQSQTPTPQKKGKNSLLRKRDRAGSSAPKPSSSPVTTPTKIQIHNPFAILGSSGVNVGSSGEKRKRSKSNASSLRRGNSSHGRPPAFGGDGALPSPRETPEPEFFGEDVGDASTVCKGRVPERGFNIARKPLPALPGQSS